MSKSIYTITTLADVAIAFSGAEVLAASMSNSATQRFTPYANVFGGASLPSSVNTNLIPVTAGAITPFTTNANFNTGWTVGGAAGVKWNDMLRAEAELSYAQWSAKDTNIDNYGFALVNSPARGTLSATYLMGNLWADVKNTTAFTPYFGAGVGVAFVNNAGVDFGFRGYGYTDGPQTRLDWQLGAGVKYDVNEHVALDIGYRFKTIEGLQFGNTTTDGNTHVGGSLSSHNVALGLTYSF